MKKDLIALVADVQQEKTLETLVSERQKSLHMRAISFDLFRHPRKDPGVYQEAAEFLRPYAARYDYALVLMDQAWQGSPGDARTLSETMHEQIARTGWTAPTFQVVVIEPELEAWVWAASPAVPEVLRTTWEAIQELAQRRNYWSTGDLKPHEPKALLEAVLRQQRRPRSAAIFQALARRISLSRCQDPAFALLRETLARWFPEGQS
jgi:hypothetical protein